MIGLIVNKEHEDLNEEYKSEEDNKILITQEISS